MRLREAEEEEQRQRVLEEQLQVMRKEVNWLTLIYELICLLGVYCRRRG